MAMPRLPWAGSVGSQKASRPLAASRVTKPAPASLRRLEMPMATVRVSSVFYWIVETMRVKFDPIGREKVRVSDT